MNPSINPVLTIVSVGYGASLALLTGTLLFRKPNNTFPRFKFYVLSLLAQEAILLGCTFAYSYFWYYWLYVITQPICSLILLSMLCEVFAEVFHPWRTLPEKSIPILVLCCVLAISIGFGLFAAAHPHPRGSLYMIFLGALQAACSIVTACGFGFVVLFSDYFGIPWRRRVYGIGIGALVGTLSDAVISFFPQHPALAGVNTCCWIFSIGLWNWYFTKPDTARLHLTAAEVEMLRAGTLEQVELSNQAVAFSLEVNKQ